jgi:hypothetical protein
MARGQQNTLMNLGQLTRAISLRHLSISSLSDGNLGRTSFNHSGGPLALGDLGQTSTRKSSDLPSTRSGFVRSSRRHVVL